jgi:prepilin-type N-terminal cleavage/methylation domain-containing protein
MSCVHHFKHRPSTTRVTSHHAGFTLVEMAVVVVIAGLIITAILPALQDMRRSTQLSTTQTNLQSLLRATAAYALANGCLPCPTAGNKISGSERGKVSTPNNTACGTCAVADGIAPYASLGIDPATAKDGWGRWITMHVDIASWFTILLREATDCDASDLHFVPEANALLIKMRVDGLLHTIKTMHHDFWPALLQRIKILAGVNIAETRRPQDGRFTQPCGAVMIDCRVGFMPTTHGEAVALRLLDPRRAERSFAAMGFAPQQIAQFEDWLRRPEGLILVTGLPSHSALSAS